MNRHCELHELGWTDWFEQRAECRSADAVARVALAAGAKHGAPPKVGGGMREFGILGAEGGIGGSFPDITALASDCRYRNCSHACEPGCAVIEALNSGEISQEHYENYLKLREESEFYQMSYAERRKRDRDFGRYIKSAKKDLRDY